MEYQNFSLSLMAGFYLSLIGMYLTGYGKNRRKKTRLAGALILTVACASFVSSYDVLLPRHLGLALYILVAFGLLVWTSVVFVAYKKSRTR